MIRTPVAGQTLDELLFYRPAIITANEVTSLLINISVACLALKYVNWVGVANW